MNFLKRQEEDAINRKEARDEGLAEGLERGRVEAVQALNSESVNKLYSLFTSDKNKFKLVASAFPFEKDVIDLLRAEHPDAYNFMVS